MRGRVLESDCPAQRLPSCLASCRMAHSLQASVFSAVQWVEYLLHMGHYLDQMRACYQVQSMDPDRVCAQQTLTAALPINTIMVSTGEHTRKSGGVVEEVCCVGWGPEFLKSGRRSRKDIKYGFGTGFDK